MDIQAFRVELCINAVPEGGHYEREKNGGGCSCSGYDSGNSNNLCMHS